MIRTTFGVVVSSLGRDGGWLNTSVAAVATAVGFSWSMHV